MSDPTTLGDLQLAIMRVLWARGEASASEVHAALLAERGLAPTTIATMLRKMEDKGVVRHRAEGRQFVYRPAVEERAVRRGMVGELVERLFLGDPAALVNHLLSDGQIDPDELEALKELIAGRERRAQGGSGRG
ncbi:MAG: BlaI/MecI/CopY family transcriptional regulator [Planctomycetes bacterium]|nr:BlaI/MecI/CopY family transcriptional regulator [Planctomycetota bacterium]